MKTMSKTNKEKWAYIAGFIDGEGTIALKRYTTKNKSNEQSKLSAYIDIVNTNKEVLNWMQYFLESVGIVSNIYSWRFTKRLSNPDLNAKRMYCLHIGSFERLIFMIDNILPFLIIKKKAAMVVREYIILRLGKLSKNRNAPYSNEEKQLYNSIKQRGFRFKIA